MRGEGGGIGEWDDYVRWGTATLTNSVAASDQGSTRGLGRNQMREVVGGQGEAQAMVGTDQRRGGENLDVITGYLARNDGSVGRGGADVMRPQHSVIGQIPRARGVQRAMRAEQSALSQ